MPEKYKALHVLPPTNVMVMAWDIDGNFYHAVYRGKDKGVPQWVIPEGGDASKIVMWQFVEIKPEE